MKQETQIQSEKMRNASSSIVACRQITRKINDASVCRQPVVVKAIHIQNVNSTQHNAQWIY